VAFKSEVREGLSASRIGSRRLALLRTGGVIRAFNGDCPHRGADLGSGGTLVDGAIRCPFHGYSIVIEPGKRARFRAEEYRVLIVGELVFARLSEAFDNGWEEILEELTRAFAIVPALRMRARVDMPIVIENAFDRRHFFAVHGVRTEEFEVGRDERGGLRVSSRFTVPDRSASNEAPLTARTASYDAVAISPGLVLVQLGGANPYGAITGAIDTGDGYCDIRLAFALPKETFGDEPDPAQYQELLAHTEHGLEEDCRVWESLAAGVSPDWTEDDWPIIEFRRYGEEFR
jgi:3-ketosteroid 9alpha-monooxygenase subunit A